MANPLHNLHVSIKKEKRLLYSYELYKEGCRINQSKCTYNKNNKFNSPDIFFCDDGTFQNYKR